MLSLIPALLLLVAAIATIGGLLLGDWFGRTAEAPRVIAVSILLGLLPSLVAGAARRANAWVARILPVGTLVLVAPLGFALAIAAMQTYRRALPAMAQARIAPIAVGFLWCAACVGCLYLVDRRVTPAGMPVSHVLVRFRHGLPSGIGAFLGLALILALASSGGWGLMATFAMAAALHGLAASVVLECLARLAAPVPDGVRAAVEAVQPETPWFQRILFLPATVCPVRVCEVWRPLLAGSTLVISEPLVQTLSVAELSALAAHEAGHVALRHHRRIYLAAALAGVLALALLVMVPLESPRPNRPPMTLLVVVMATAVGRLAWARLVMRRGEYEADQFAADQGRAGDLCAALQKVGGPAIDPGLAKWQTHPAMSERLERLRRQMRE